MQHFELTMDWTFAFDSSVTRLGLCSHRRKTISLSLHCTAVNTEEIVVNTILHEIAHALVGSGHGHNQTWKEKAQEIGCNGHRLGLIMTKATPRYRITCSGCQIHHDFYRKPQRMNRRYCTKCQTGQFLTLEALK